MLTQLTISNYALIDRLEISLDKGLTIITGETGAGKSIILGALSLILGERADTGSIRNPEQKTIVEATFDITGYALRDFFASHDIDYYETELIVRREISPGGRSRAFVNDSPVALTVLRELMTRLVDIHSQHSNMLLSRPLFQLSILDSIASCDDLLQRYREQYNRFREAERELSDLLASIEKNRSDEDYIRFQLTQLEEANLQSGEDAELELQHKRLANAEQLRDNLWQVDNLLNGDESSVLTNLQAIERALAETEPNLPDVAGMSERVQGAIIELKDIAQEVSYVYQDLNADPAMLAQVEERLNVIYSLQRKHNVASLDELIELQEQFRQRLSVIDDGDMKVEELQAITDKRRKDAAKLAAELSSKRKAAASTFINELLPSAQKLGMKNLRFEVNFTEVDLCATGADAVEFLFAFNKNQKLMPVKDTASGGEISRLMLCIKALIARSMNLPTIIFDEVDTGVSGEIASRIGEMMSDIAGKIQVIAITHLPQVAACAQEHLRVYKTDTETQTLTRVEQLTADEHIAEVARMLSGNAVNEAALANARALISERQK